MFITERFKYNIYPHLIMKYFLTTQKKPYGKYYLYKCNYREKGIFRSKYVYLGKEEIALKIISDFNTKKPLNERLLSFSGEIIFSKILELLDFRRLINRIVNNGAKFDIGRFIEMIVIERALNEYSKWRLARLAHKKSFFSLDTRIKSENFTENNIYNYMDYIYPKLDLIQKEIVKNLLNTNNLEFNELIIDGTSVYCFGTDEVEGQENQSKKDKQLKRTHGYSRDKRSDLAQINLMLGVSNHYIPLLFETYSGNTSDVVMFKKILEKCRSDYSTLLKAVQSKYLVFDKGNNSEDNFEELNSLCSEWSFYFVASVRPSMIKVKKQLLPLKIEDLPVIYEQKNTKLRGKTSTIFLYKRERNVLLYANEEIMRKKQDEFLEQLEKIREKVLELNQKKDNVKDKLETIEKLLRKNRLFSCFKRESEDNDVKCVPIKEKINEKINLFGKFAIITNDFKLDAASIVRLYKTCGVVEREFHLLKSVLSVCPINHRKPERIKVNFALVLWGIMAFALLRFLLMQNKIELTFEKLKDILTDGCLSIGDYIYPGYKSFRIQRTLNINPELERVFKIFRLKFDYFDIKVLPTVREKNKEGN